MKKHLHELRVRIDGLAKLLSTMQPLEFITLTGTAIEYTGSREEQKAIDDLLLAKAWLGKCLEIIGEDSPYKNDGKRKYIQDIEPTADQPKQSDNGYTVWVGLPTGWWQDSTLIEKIDWIRERIKGLTEDNIQETFELDLSDPTSSDIISCLNHHIRHLHEARFWLGFDLARIRDNNK